MFFYLYTGLKNFIQYLINFQNFFHAEKIRQSKIILSLILLKNEVKNKFDSNSLLRHIRCQHKYREFLVVDNRFLDAFRSETKIIYTM